MKVRTRFPRAVREVEHLSIPLPDGCRLAARLWLPDGAEAEPVPAVLEYIPYRKRDRTRWRDEPMHGYFAGHGYAALRVDIRGSGDSEGVLLDEYLEQEQDDGVAVLAWVAAQPWCNGRIGMLGKSWGGFNVLQIAARRPPALKAVVSVCSTDDRYADDAHYMGGCLLNENLLWGSTLLTLNALPPDPKLVGESWRDMWRERLEATPFFPERWLRHPHRDDYWRHGSVCEDFSRIACPVFVVGGWADAYTNAVPRLLSGLESPKFGLVGPWAHLYPHDGVPGPAIGFLQECVKFWDRWLAEEPADEPPFYRVFVPEALRAERIHEPWPGRWVAEAAWPSPRLVERRLTLGEGSLAPGGSPERALTIESPQSVGLAAGGWCSFGAPADLPGDQREDDGRSLCFDTAPLEDRLEILGGAVLELTLAADRPLALVAARLNDVAPDGASTRVSYGLLNLAHRDSHESPRPLEPGRRATLRLRLNQAAYAFPPGHRLRLALSTAYWPIAWPAPEPVRLSVFTGTSRLTLPVRPPDAGDGQLPPFERPEGAPPPEDDELRAGRTARRVTHDAVTGESVCRLVKDADAEGRPALHRIAAIDLTVGHGVVEEYRIRDADPLSARAEIRHRAELERSGWTVRVETRSAMWATRDSFRLEASLVAEENGARVVERRWDVTVPRLLV